MFWYVVKKGFPNEVGDFQFFAPFIFVIVPFVMLIFFGLALINYDAMATRSGWQPVLPLKGPLSPPIVGAVIFYVGQTVWLWRSWGKERMRAATADARLSNFLNVVFIGTSSFNHNCSGTGVTGRRHQRHGLWSSKPTLVSSNRKCPVVEARQSLRQAGAGATDPLGHILGRACPNLVSKNMMRVLVLLCCLLLSGLARADEPTITGSGGRCARRSC